MKQVVLFVSLIGVSIGSYHYSEKPQTKGNLTVNLYYESLCPGCLEFTTTQLCPAWNKLSEYFQVDFVPYGNAKTNISEAGEITIKCQHGEDECEGNRVHSCGLKYLSYEQSTKFICCVESSQQSIDKAGPDCAQKLGIDYNPIKKCANGPEGNKLHYQNGIRTSKLEPSHQWVPWILINEVYNKEEMARAQEDLISTLCKHIQDPKPRECNEVF